MNRNGRAKWEDMVWKRFTSTEASNLSYRKDVVKEHVVPLNIIATILVQHSKEQILNTEKISEILDKYVTFATISKREDKLLRDAKLSKKMPEGFWEVKNPLYNDLFARYKFVGIELNLISNTSNN